MISVLQYARLFYFGSDRSSLILFGKGEATIGINDKGEFW